MKDEARFWAKVDLTPNALGCLLWTGAIGRDGYGRIWTGEPGRPTRRAHRVAFELEHGAIPEGMVLMHSCDERRCVNVNHLRVGTQAQNLEDMTQKGRRRGGRRRKSIVVQSGRIPRFIVAGTAL